jgi:hypothetical protein
MGVFRTISSDVLSLGMAFGALDSQTGRTIMQIFSVVRLMTSLKAILATTTATQAAHNVAVGAGAGVQSTLAVSTTEAVTAQAAQNIAVGAGVGVQTTLTGATIGATTAQTAQNVSTNQGVISQIAHKIALVATTAAHYIHAAGAWIATTAQNALNISYATFLALTGVGIAVIVAAAAAMAYFASQMNSATSSVRSFNGAAGALSGNGRNIQRAGETEMYRRGVE